MSLDSRALDAMRGWALARRHALVALACGLGLALGHGAVHAAEEWNIDTLMRLQAQTQSSRATFVELKYLSSLETPLESSGELSYRAPDRLEKRTLKPTPESLVLDKDTLLLERKGRKRSIPLQSYPEVGAFVESIRATLAGDRAGLDRNYQLELEGKRERWRLLLKPLNAKAAVMVSQIRLSGQGEQVDTIEILQSNGDRSVMTVTPQPPAN
ncbi:LolA-related protein [Aquabacterium sp.]|uniref:LolA-related protein n=1 Tax=Aquabacterium sp. TaxID=1872578 RepID=UPI002488A63C|nr:LolA-related protein [Aquabacterium sp.]MDI1258446.1 outer-membrane lipoprotein carrier protein LolA [Aquabacterium sp.]